MGFPMFPRIASLALIAMSSVARADDWPQFLGPNRDGVSRETGLLRAWPNDGPPRLWKRDVGAGFAGPVVVGDKLILFHAANGKETVDCVGPTTGEPRWSFSYPCDFEDSFGKGDGPRATPTIFQDRVIISGADGKLTCLGLEKGDKRWQRDLTAD